MHAILSLIEKHGVLPAIVLEHSSKAGPLAAALLEGGLPIAEVTLRTPESLTALEKMASFSPDLLVGAGTVLSVRQADDAITAGARYIVSPGIDAYLVKHCLDRDVPIIPGVATPTEMMLAVNLGLTCVKFFPGQALGGLAMLKALNGPFPDMRFLPTGGMSLESLSDFLSFRPVLAVGGTWMVRKEWLDRDRFDVVADACATTVEKVKLARRIRS